MLTRRPGGGRHVRPAAPLLPYLVSNPPLTTFKRHTFSHTLRTNPKGGLPREMLLADFDVVLPVGTASPSSAAAVEAELLRVAHDVLLDAVPDFDWSNLIPLIDLP